MIAEAIKHLKLAEAYDKKRHLCASLVRDGTKVAKCVVLSGSPLEVARLSSGKHLVAGRMKLDRCPTAVSRREQ